MRSRCSGVSGGNESTTVWTCSASIVAARSRVVGSVMLGGPCAVRPGCLWEGGSDLGESMASISGGVAVGRACSALLCVLVVLSFELFGLPVRYVSFPQEKPWCGWEAFRRVLTRPPPVCAEYANRPISRRVLLRGRRFRWVLLVRGLPGCRW